ncbi:MAG: RNA polymerase sigma factor [Acidimicrobiales bacterium]
MLAPSPVDSVDLTAALADAQRGDQWAMALLFRAFQPPLLRYLRHHAPDAAEDLAAECWLAASKVLATFEGDAEDLRAWLFGVARNQVADHHRTRQRRLRLARAGEPSRPATPLDPAEVVVESLSATEAVELLVRSLPRDQSEVVLLRVVAGLSVEQVATILGKSPGSIRVVQHRALRRLAKTWQRETVTR